MILWQSKCPRLWPVPGLLRGSSVRTVQLDPHRSDGSLPNIHDHPIGLLHDEWHDGEIPLGYNRSKTLPDPCEILTTPVLEIERKARLPFNQK